MKDEGCPDRNYTLILTQGIEARCALLEQSVELLEITCEAFEFFWAGDGLWGHRVASCGPRD